jgi:hypothetical protein
VGKLGVNDFQQEVIDRLARIETKQDATAETVKQNTATINQHSIDITENRQSAKSAHHRIDGIFLTAGIVGAVAGWVADFVAKIFSRGGQ